MSWPNFDQINAILNFAAACIGILSAVFAVLAWRKARQIRQAQRDDERRRSEPIRLRLANESTGEEHVLGYRPRRDQATRAEVLGVLGMYLGKPRFESSKLVPILESGEFDRMISGLTSEVRFPVSADDFERLKKGDQKAALSARGIAQPKEASDAASGMPQTRSNRTSSQTGREDTSHG